MENQPGKRMQTDIETASKGLGGEGSGSMICGFGFRCKVRIGVQGLRVGGG